MVSHGWSLVTICGDACPLSCVSAWLLRPASQLAQCTRPQGWELINAALLSLINEAGECMLCYPPLESTRRPRFVCRHDRVTREVGRVGIVGRDRGRRGYWVALYLFIYTARLSMSVFLYRCLIHACMQAGRPATQHTSHRRPGPNWAVRVDRAYSSPPTCSPAPSVIAD